MKTLESGLAVQSGNADLKRLKKEVMELQRGEQVAAYCRKVRAMRFVRDCGAQMGIGLSDVFVLSF